MNYYMGIDLARKSDWTVTTVIDGDGHVVAMDRFHQISWSLQVERCAMLYRTFHCVKAVVDSTGIGDVVIEQLEAQGLTIEAYLFTVPSRKALIEGLVLAFDNCEITIPATERFAVYRAELESFEYTLDGSTIRYEAPSGHNDDCVMSLALAVHGWRASRGAVLGIIDLLKRRAAEVVSGIRDKFGELIHKPTPKPVPISVRGSSKPAETRVEGNKGQPPRSGPCPACHSTATNWKPGGFPGRPWAIHCNQCGAEDGIPLPKEIDGNTCPVEGCGLRLVTISGVRLCQNHGQVFQPVATAVGVSRGQYLSRRSGFGRFG